MKINSSEYFKSILGNPDDFEKLLLFDNVNELLYKCSETFKDSICLQYLGGSKTYIELREDAERISNVLANKGVKKGDVVGLIFRNEYDFVASFFACLRLGAIAALLPASFP